MLEGRAGPHYIQGVDGRWKGRCLFHCFICLTAGLISDVAVSVIDCIGDCTKNEAGRLHDTGTGKVGRQNE